MSFRPPVSAAPVPSAPISTTPTSQNTASLPSAVPPQTVQDLANISPERLAAALAPMGLSRNFSLPQNPLLPMVTWPSLSLALSTSERHNGPVDAPPDRECQPLQHEPSQLALPREHDVAERTNRPEWRPLQVVSLPSSPSPLWP